MLRGVVWRMNFHIGTKCFQLIQKSLNLFLVIAGDCLEKLTMNDIWKKLKELYDANPIIFGVLLFIDLSILYFIIQYFLN